MCKDVVDLKDELRVGNRLLAMATDKQRDLEAENEKLRNVLLRIDTWAKAYPLKAFPKPDLAKAHEVLTAAGMTLDAIFADNMRHVLDNIKEMVSEVLKEE